MARNGIEHRLPWAGAVAGLAWIAQEILFVTSTDDQPGRSTAGIIQEHLARNYAAVGCLVLMGIAIAFFASALRGHLRSGEARESTYSSVAFGGLILVSAGLSQMVVGNWAMINGAATAGDDASLHVLSYVTYFGWAGMGIGIATTFIATALAGLSSSVLPRWFAIATLVMGILSALGNAGIPPGGLVSYLLLPLWFITAAVVLARPRTAAAAKLSALS